MFGRYGLRNLTTDDQPNIPLPSGGAGNGHIYARNRQFVLGSTWTPTTPIAARSRASAIRGRRRARIRRRSAADSAFDQFGLPGLPTDPPHRRRPADAADHRLLGSRPPGDQPAVAVPDRLQPEDQLHLDDGRALAQERLRVPADRHRSAGRQPALRPRHLQRPVHAGRPAPRRAISTTSPTSCSACARSTRSAACSSPTCAGTCTSPTCRTTGASDRAAHAQPRRALRVLDAVLGEGQRPVELRSGDERDGPREGRLDLRSRADQSRPQQLRAAARLRLHADARHRRPRRLRHQLRALQPRRRRRPPADQRPAGGQRGRQPDGADRADVRARASRAIRPAWPIRRSSIR